MADRKTIGKVVNNMKNPENFDVSYHIHEGIGDPVIYNDKDEGMYNLETKENVPIEKVFLGEEYPIENIVIHFGAFADVEIDTLVIPEGVTDIPEYCFYEARIKTLKLPSTLESIGILDPAREFRSSRDQRNFSNAFAKAEIGTLVIPEGVKSIPVECFKEAKIKTLILPSTLETISAGAFAEVEIDTLVIPEGVTEIPMGFFYGAKIKTLILPSTLKTIGGAGTFSDVEIDTLVIPKGVTEIPNLCFQAAKIKTLKLPSTLGTIGAGAFSDVEIDTLVIPKGVREIRPYCFEGAKIKTLKLSSKLGIGAFFRAEIGTLKIPAGVTEIPNGCFEVAKVKTLKLSNALKTIGESAFFNSEIESLYIKNVSSIGYNAFEGFQGTIFTDNSESKDRFVNAGLDTKQVVDLSSREGRFEALKDKTLPEIRKLEKDLNIDLWDKDYMGSVEENLFLGLPNEATSIMFQHLTLFQLDQIKKDKGFSNNSKNESNYDSNKSKVNVTKEVSIFNPPLDNENKGTKKKQQK